MLVYNLLALNLRPVLPAHLRNPNERIIMNSTLKTLFMDQLEDVYYAEHQITEALPKLIEAATCRDLQSALKSHLAETEGQIEKLERVFKTFDEKPKSVKCEAITGILKEGDSMVKDNKKGSAINAAIIAAGQKVEHYEIATYGCLKAWAGILGNNDAVSLLGEILEEEKNADRTLNDLSSAKNEEAFEEVPAGAARH
jgi:ferritin-like metal-binding protein YciE